MAQPLTMPSQAGWTTTAPTYSSNVGRTSAISAARLSELAHALSPISFSSEILGMSCLKTRILKAAGFSSSRQSQLIRLRADNGAGTGAITFEISSQYAGANILATDISAGMLKNIDQAKLLGVKTKVLDTRSLSKEMMVRKNRKCSAYKSHM